MMYGGMVRGSDEVLNRNAHKAVVYITSALLAGCSLFPQHIGLLEKQTPEARISSAQLRVWTNDFILDYADRIEEVADRIKAQELSHEVRRNTVLWKINATQAGFRAASRRDALGAFVDVWILCRQMTVFFESGPGKDSFGASQDMAVMTAKGLESRIEEIRVAMVRPEHAKRMLATGREFIGTFAQAHPLTSLYFQRDSLSGRSETIVLPDSASFGTIASGLEQDVITLQRLVSAYMEFMPTLARWQAELMLYDVEKSPLVVGSVSVLEDMPILVREAMTTQVPQLVSGQMTRALMALSTERINTLTGLEGMRADTLKFVEQERNAVITEINRQRVATIEQVGEERKAALEDVRSIARESTGSALSVGKELIDHLFWRLAILVGAVALCVALGAGVVMMVMRLRGQRSMIR
jgi:hypothetical protein